VTTANITQEWNGLTTLRYGQRAAGVEMAARRRIQWAGHFFSQDDSLPFLLDERVSYWHR
jgi:hypothetical protein